MKVDIIKNYIKEHKDNMNKAGLLNIYIRENEESPTVLFTLKADSKPHWYSLINVVTEHVQNMFLAIKRTNLS